MCALAKVSHCVALAIKLLREAQLISIERDGLLSAPGISMLAFRSRAQIALRKTRGFVSFATQRFFSVSLLSLVALVAEVARSVVVKQLLTGANTHVASEVREYTTIGGNLGKKTLPSLPLFLGCSTSRKFSVRLRKRKARPRAWPLFGFDSSDVSLHANVYKSQRISLSEPTLIVASLVLVPLLPPTVFF